MSLGSLDSEFDRYRKQRIRFRNRQPLEGAGYESQALRELEQVEARELQDQQLTREVHEFFSDATRQAASIVERMAHDAEAKAEVQVEMEMEAFLIDSFARMNTLVMDMLHKQKTGTAQTLVEPQVGNIVGEALDEFRWEGTADLLDKHIGQDPFATDLDEVQREFKTQLADKAAAETEERALVPIEEHLVAAVDADVTDDGSDDHAAEETSAVEVVEGGDAEDMAPEHPSAVSTDEVDSEAADPTAEPPVATPRPYDEIERFKEALKTLVRQGTMNREEARAAWHIRLRALGMKRG